MSTGRIHSIETLGAVDGPGVRVVVFLSGCPLRCVYCHNPDTRNPEAGELIEADALVQRVLRYRPYFGTKGGVTFSGGEPLLQAAFVRKAVRLLHAEGISVAIDTSGGVWNAEVRALISEADLIILDVKHTDPAEFQRITDRDMDTFLLFFEECVRLKKRLWIRQVIVPGLNDTVENVRELKKFIQPAHAERVELLGYHTLGVHKWEQLGIDYPLSGVEPASEELMEQLNQELNSC